MAHLRRVLSSPIGNKWLMALSGLALSGFLVIHLAGNLTITIGWDTFDAYAHHLHSLGPLVLLAEAGLLALGLIHIIFALIVVTRNLLARGSLFRGKASEGNRSWGSRTMLITGPYILVFVIMHLLHFTFRASAEPISSIVAARFTQPPWVAFYAISMGIIGLHLSHGLWSSWQTLGVPTQRRGWLHRLGFLLGAACAVGFATIPLFVFAHHGS